MNTIQENIAKKIESGSLKMRPRSYFVVKGVLIGLGIILLAGVLLYLGSFAIYEGLPLVPIIAAIATALLLERVIYNFAPAYRWPIAFSLGLLLLVGVLGSAGLHRLGFHERFERYSEENEMPIFKPFYRHYRHPMAPRMMR